ARPALEETDRLPRLARACGRWPQCAAYAPAGTARAAVRFAGCSASRTGRATVRCAREVRERGTPRVFAPRSSSIPVGVRVPYLGNDSDGAYPTATLNLGSNVHMFDGDQLTQKRLIRQMVREYQLRPEGAET